MNEDNRRILVNQQVVKAERFLSQADDMCSQNLWDLASNRYYYACFHVVQGLFIADGISAHTHAGIISQFSLHYVKTGKIEPTFGSFLSRLLQLRQKADYNCAYDVTKEEVEDIVDLSHKFVETVKAIILN